MHGAPLHAASAGQQQQTHEHNPAAHHQQPHHMLPGLANMSARDLAIRRLAAGAGHINADGHNSHPLGPQAASLVDPALPNVVDDLSGFSSCFGMHGMLGLTGAGFSGNSGVDGHIDLAAFAALQSAVAGGPSGLQLPTSQGGAGAFPLSIGLGADGGVGLSKLPSLSGLNGAPLAASSLDFLSVRDFPQLFVPNGNTGVNHAQFADINLGLQHQALLAAPQQAGGFPGSLTGAPPAPRAVATAAGAKTAKQGPNKQQASGRGKDTPRKKCRRSESSDYTEENEDDGGSDEDYTDGGSNSGHHKKRAAASFHRTSSFENKRQQVQGIEVKAEPCSSPARATTSAPAATKAPSADSGGLASPHSGAAGTAAAGVNLSKKEVRALNKRHLNREAQRRFRSRQKQTFEELQARNDEQQKELVMLRVQNRMLEEQYKELSENFKALQMKLMQTQLRQGMLL